MPTTDNNIKARVIADSINKHGCRLTTMVWTLPRIVLAEITRHRMMSFSVASSRAIPIQKQIEKVRHATFFPSWIGMNQSGMVANEEISPEGKERFRYEWLLSAECACNMAETLERIGVHKQITNRVLEPYGYVDIIISGTEWANLFHLRCHPDAQPELMAGAFKALAAYVASTPERTDSHIPFGDQMEHGLTSEEKQYVAGARCARISYDNHEGTRDPKIDIAMTNRLIKVGHLSPFEHIATSHINDTFVGNFRGWVQMRKKLPSENIVKLDYEKLLLTRPTWV